MGTEKKGLPDILGYPLAYVEWEDSSSAGGWNGLDVIVETGTTPCHSVGWLVAEDERELVLVAHLTRTSRSKEGGEPDRRSDWDGDGDMTIPKSAIRRRLTLAEATAHARGRK